MANLSKCPVCGKICPKQSLIKHSDFGRMNKNIASTLKRSGKCDSVISEFSTFGAKLQTRYFDAIRKMVTDSELCHINFSVV